MRPSVPRHTEARPDLAKRRIIAADVGDQRACETLRIRLPGTQPAGPLQSLLGRMRAADDAVVIVGALAVADRAAIADDLGKIAIGSVTSTKVVSGINVAASRGTSGPMFDIAGEHDLRGAQPRRRRDDALAHARRIDRQRRRVLEDARARLLGQRGKAECVIERMDVEGVRDNGAR